MGSASHSMHHLVLLSLCAHLSFSMCLLACVVFPFPVCSFCLFDPSLKRFVFISLHAKPASIGKLYVCKWERDAKEFPFPVRLESEQGHIDK